MADLEAIERELAVARKHDDNDARVRLITHALELSEAHAHRAEFLDELAYAYQQLGRFDDAVAAMRDAVAAGWTARRAPQRGAAAVARDEPCWGFGASSVIVILSSILSGLLAIATC